MSALGFTIMILSFFLFVLIIQLGGGGLITTFVFFGCQALGAACLREARLRAARRRAEMRRMRGREIDQRIADRIEGRAQGHPDAPGPPTAARQRKEERLRQLRGKGRRHRGER